MSLSALAAVTTFAFVTTSVPEARAEDTLVAEHVAAALYDRGMVLFEQGDVANAKKMFGESLERSAQGPRAADALRMLRACNEKLGIDDLNAGLPDNGGDAPLDPYAGGEGPLDPYGTGGQGGEAGAGDANTGEGPLDPYGQAPDGGGSAGPVDEASDGAASYYGFVGTSAVWGLIGGMTLLGPYEDSDDDGDLDDFSGGAVLTGILGGVGVGYLAHYLSEKMPIRGAKAAAIASGNFWGMYNFAHLGNVFAGVDSDANDVYLGMTLGGLAGSGLGYWYAAAADPSEGDVAVVNSFSAYGTLGGLFLGVAIDPPRGDAYSLNAALGSAAGLAAGMYFADELSTTRERMLYVDLGAAAGAALPWITIYPLSDSAPAAGFFSMLGVFGGAYAGWYFTDEDEDEGAALPATEAAAPALLRLDGDGELRMGTPLLAPMVTELAPQDGTSLGATVFSGRF